MRRASLLLGLIAIFATGFQTALAQPSPGMGAEARALDSLRTSTGGEEYTKISEKNGRTVQLYWWNFKSKTVDYRVLIMDETWDRSFIDSPPAWSERCQVLGLDAIRSKRNSSREGSSFATYWIYAKPYLIESSGYPKPDTPEAWDPAKWEEVNQAALARANQVLHALADAMLIHLDEEQGVVNLTANCSLGGVIGGLDVLLQLPHSSEPIKVTTDSFGRAKAPVPIPDKDKDIKGSVVGCVYHPATKIAGRPSYIAGDLKLEFATPFVMSSKKGFSENVELRLFVKPIYVKVERTDSFDSVVDCGITLFMGGIDGNPLVRVPRWSAPKANESGQLELRVPVSRTNGGAAATVLAVAEFQGAKWEGWDDVVIPTRDVNSAAVRISLEATDLKGQFDKYRPKVREALERAGFSSEEVKKIMEMKIVLGSKTNYKNGVIQITQSSTLRGNSESLLHEMGHLISDVIATDEPDGVGITHELHEPVNLNAAFDEGRAHFYAFMLGRLVGLPGGKPLADSPEGVNNCENRELYIQKALLEHYTNKNLFSDPAQALANFRQIQQSGKASLGHPPRTIMEFIQLADTMQGESDERKNDLLRIRSAYGFGV